MDNPRDTSGLTEAVLQTNSCPYVHKHTHTQTHSPGSFFTDICECVQDWKQVSHNISKW